jgi:hypothetical protein
MRNRFEEQQHGVKESPWYWELPISVSSGAKTK